MNVSILSDPERKKKSGHALCQISGILACLVVRIKLLLMCLQAVKRWYCLGFLYSLKGPL
jgi:hypothetical protein